MCSGDKKDKDKSETKPGTTKTSGAKDSKIAKKMQQTSAFAGQNARRFLAKASGLIENSSSVKQLAIGAAGGWISGIVTHRVGKTAGFTIGGSILLIAAAEQTGIININWNKLGKNVHKLTGKAESMGQQPNVQYMKKYARNNTYFAAGFLGGFLIGVCT